MRWARAVALTLLTGPALSLADEQDLPDGAPAALEPEPCADGDSHCLALRRARTAEFLGARGPATEAAEVEPNATQDDGAEVVSASSEGRNIMTLFHQTSPWAGRSILRTGFRIGNPHSWCGSAIYFAHSARGTNLKAVGGRGFIIEAVVDMGKMLHTNPYCNWPNVLYEWQLRMKGYDSITLDRGRIAECRHLAHCHEYIIYDPRRIISMKGYPLGWSPNPVIQGNVSQPTSNDDEFPEGLDPNTTIDDCR